MKELETIMQAAQQARLTANEHQIIMDCYVKLKEELTPKGKK